MIEDWTFRHVDGDVEFCGPDPDLDASTVPLAVVIAAINASGTHWVAPREATEAMERGWTKVAAKRFWRQFRDAYLAEQGHGR